MKLFLSSQGIPENLRPAFLSLFNKTPAAIRLAYINTAAEIYPESERWWEQDALADVTASGPTLEPLDLKSFTNNPQGLEKRLAEFDGVWLSGGHTYYLRYWLQASGFDQIIQPLLKKGFVYAGFSAATMVAGNTLELFDQFDPEDQQIIEPERIYQGLNLVDTAILPHYKNGDPVREGQHNQIIAAFTEAGMKLTNLSDQQAIVQDGETWQLL